MLCSRVGAACCPDGRRVASSFCCAGLLARRRRRRSAGLPSSRCALPWKQGNLSLVRVRRAVALSPRTHAWEQPSFVCRGCEGNAAVCSYLTRGGRGRRAHKPTEPQRSLRRFCCFGFPTVGFTRRACEERAWCAI